MTDPTTQHIPSTPHPSILALLLTLPLTYLLTLALYRLYLHPLSPYPGPLLGRLTKWHDVYHAHRGDKHILLHRLHAQYGPVVRFSPNSLSINHPAALRAIYGHGANVRKSDFYRGFRAHPQAISTLLATERSHHARKRRILGQAFSESAMRGLEVFVLENVGRFLGGIEERVGRVGGEWSEGVDMGRWNNWLVFDIMGDLVFGKSFGTLGEKPENRDAIRLLGRAARRNYIVGAMPFLYKSGLERWIPPFRGLWLDRLQYFAFGRRQVVERTANKALDDAGRKDIFHYLLHARDPETGEGLPQSELWMEGNTLIVAGSDTSSTTLSATLYYLLRNPACLQRLISEIRSTFSQDGEEAIRTGPKLQSCTYLRACIDEAMRMSPAVPGLLPRLVLDGGLHIPAPLNLHIPAGVDVGTCTYAIQHHEDYIADPFTYDPSRWLRQDDGEKRTHRNRQRSDSGIDMLQRSSPPVQANHTHAKEKEETTREALHSCFAPFSLGNRSCLGKPLVYMELSIALARLVWRYEMRLVDVPLEVESVREDLKRGRRVEGEYQLRDWFLSANEGPVVEFARRGDLGGEGS